VSGYTVVIDDKEKKAQPFQIDLFSDSVNKNPKFSNLLTLYDQVPHYSSEHSLASSTAKQTQFLVADSVWFLENSPAVFFMEGAKGSKGETVSRFSGKREELIMAGLLKLAAANPVMAGDKLGVPFYLRELQRIIGVGNKIRYSITEIKLALRILKNSNYRLMNYSEEGDQQTWEYSQISELMTSSSMGSNDDRYFVVFNRLLTEQILSLQIRLYNFDRFKLFHRSLSRPLYKRLCLRFIQAAVETTYTIKISTLRELGGLSYVHAMAIDKRRLPVVNAFKELVKCGVLISYQLIKSIKERQVTGTKRRLRTIDEEYELQAAPDFIAEQKKASAIRNEAIEKMKIADEQSGGLTAEDKDNLLALSPALVKKLLP